MVHRRRTPAPGRQLAIDQLEPRLALSHSPTDHIHAVLQIELEGEDLSIPANVGLSATGHFNPHTHDDTGELHIGEGGPAGLGNTIRFLTLEDFFDVWREQAGLAGNRPDAAFSSTQIMDRRADAQSEVVLLVNGVKNDEYEKYVPHDGDQIEIQFNRTSWHNAQLPTDVNGRDGTTPIDALLAISELNNREFSDPRTGRLGSVPKKFYDVDNDQHLGPIDPLRIIGALPNTSGSSAVGIVGSSDAVASFGWLADQDERHEGRQSADIYDLVFAQSADRAW